MAYRRHDLTSLVHVAPADAARRVMAAYTKAHGLQAAAAAALGADVRTLARWVQMLGLGEKLVALRERGRRQGWYRDRPRKLSDQDIAEAHRMLAQGHTQADVAKHFNVSQPAISAAVRRPPRAA